ncbi:MAG: hypothetical protein D6689_12545 [Deltaproteobacteria bacterium]|nr:MAG: hypothetical protein D6689_12545 [Deltaproteobacteria bacterium]
MSRILATAVLLLCACGSDAPSTAAAIHVPFRVLGRSADGDGTLRDRVAATDLPDDAWRAFVADARAALGGDPADIAVTAAAIALAPSSEGVARLAEVFDGPVTVRCELTASGRAYPLAEGLIYERTEPEPVALAPRFALADVEPDDVGPLLVGEFDVVFVGQGGGAFRGSDARADLSVTLEIAAR